MSKKNTNKPIISALIGGAFFAVPYLALNVSLLPSLGIAVIAYGAGNLLLSDSSNKLESNNSNESFYDLLNNAKKNNAKIYEVMNKIEDRELVKNIEEIHDTSSKIIDEISKSPSKLNKGQNFFNYYLPTTLKLLITYDNIENQNLNTDEIKATMENTKQMIIKINSSLKIQLSNLFQSEIIDTDAEIKVFESMLKSEGINAENDFDLK